MSRASKIWLGTVLGGLGVFVIAAFTLPKSFGLTAFTDIFEMSLLLSGAASFVPLARRAQGRMRLFWSLIILGMSFWFIYQLCWVYFEVVLRSEVPDIFAGDIILFLNMVPLMAALALRPHVPRDEYAARLGRLDFALLLVWWFYLYLLIVIPWQYVVADVPAYGRNLNAVYSVEKLALLVGLVACWIASKDQPSKVLSGKDRSSKDRTGKDRTSQDRSGKDQSSKDQWRRLYASLFGMSFSYSASSALANWAIGRHTYYSGSFYDIPLAMAMAWVTWIGLRTRVEAPQDSAREVSTVYGVWVARCSTIAVFSLPLFAAWAIAETDIPSRIRIFRLALTLGAAFVMGVMVFIRQYLLDRELTRLLHRSRDSFDNLKRLQAQLLQSEKLASIGNLVGGAAHELNNPITAMLGYSDLLLSTSLTPEQAPLAAKIGQYVRRTKSLVASLISFARQAPSPKTPVDLNTLARTAVKLTQPQWEALHIDVRSQFDTELPKVLGDSNQLLQVCVQLVGNCLYVMSELGGKVLTVSTTQEQGMSILHIATEPLAVSASAKTKPESVNSSPINPEDGLGLSACHGILQEHRGHISREPLDDGAMLLRVELPSLEAVPAKPKPAKDSIAPALWRSRPYA
jgi:signal transduction histidine kinase